MLLSLPTVSATWTKHCWFAGKSSKDDYLKFIKILGTQICEKTHLDLDPTIYQALIPPLIGSC